MILREAWREVCGGGSAPRAGEREKKEREMWAAERDTSTHERWEQVRGRVGGEVDGWRKGERE